MIWDIIETSTFNDHFKNQELMIEELLQDENIITEMKNLNPQLLQYIETNSDQVFSRMIEYVTVLPKQQDGKNRGYLYPYVSSEILAIDSQTIYKAFFQELQPNLKTPTKHWKALLQALNQNKVVENPVLLGYFTKILNNLYKGCKLDFTRIILTDQQTRKQFINHIHQETVGQIVKNLFVLLDTPQQMLLVFDNVIKPQRQTYLKQVIDTFVDPEHTADPERRQLIRKVIATQVLTPIIIKFQTYSSGQELVHCILQKAPLFLSVYEIHDSLAIMELLTNILRKSKQTISTAQDWKKQYIFVIPKIHRIKLIDYIENHLATLYHKYNSEDTVPSEIKNQNHAKVRATHPQILLYCTLLVEMTENKIQLDKNSSKKIMQFLFRVMIDHPYNDILQTKIRVVCSFLSTLTAHENTQARQQLLIPLLTHFANVTRLRSIHHRPHLYELWKSIKQHKQAFILLKKVVQMNQISAQDWQQTLEQYFGPMEKVEKIKWGTHLKGHFGGKIVVDEEDKVSAPKDTYMIEVHPDQPSQSPIQHITASEAQKQSSQVIKQNIQQLKKAILFQEFDAQLKSTNNTNSADDFQAFERFDYATLNQESSKEEKIKMLFGDFSDKLPKQQSGEYKTQAKKDPFASFDF